MHMLSFKDGSNPFEFIETIQLLNISYVFKGDESLIWLVPFSTQSFFYLFTKANSAGCSSYSCHRVIT